MSGSNPKRNSKSTSKKGKSRGSSKKQRPGWERIAVWSGIAVLLLIVLMEWTSKRNHESSRQALETQVSGVRQVEGETSVTLENAQKKISGFAFRSENGNGASRKVTYRWPSLFKRYQVVLTIDPANHVTLVEAVIAADNSRLADKPITPNSQDQFRKTDAFRRSECCVIDDQRICRGSTSRHRRYRFVDPRSHSTGIVDCRPRRDGVCPLAMLQLVRCFL